jgi:Transposase, Mutator family
LHKEIKRRADVVEIFPNPAAFLRLATAVVIEAHDEWQVTRRYVSDVSMDELRVIIAAKELAAAADASVSSRHPNSKTPNIQHNSLVTNQMVHRSELHHPTGRYRSPDRQSGASRQHAMNNRQHPGAKC